MHYAPSIQQDNAPCNSSLKYSRIHQGPGWWYFWGATLQCRSDPIDTDCSIVKRHVSRMSNIKRQTVLEITIKFGSTRIQMT